MVVFIAVMALIALVTVLRWARAPPEVPSGEDERSEEEKRAHRQEIATTALTVFLAKWLAAVVILWIVLMLWGGS